MGGAAAGPGSGGGVANYGGTLTVTNSTISGNTACNGGGVATRRHPHRDQQHHLGQYRCFAAAA